MEAKAYCFLTPPFYIATFIPLLIQGRHLAEKYPLLFPIEMAAAVAFRQPYLPTASTAMSAPAPSSQASTESLRSEPKPTANIKAPRGRRDRPCDACRRKKSRCVMAEGQTISCIACSAHAIQCTFLEDPRPRKRRLDSEGKIADSGKRRSANVMRGALYGRNC